MPEDTSDPEEFDSYEDYVAYHEHMDTLTMEEQLEEFLATNDYGMTAEYITQTMSEALAPFMPNAKESLILHLEEQAIEEYGETLEGCNEEAIECINTRTTDTETQIKGEIELVQEQFTADVLNAMISIQAIIEEDVETKRECATSGPCGGRPDVGNPNWPECNDETEIIASNLVITITEKTTKLDALFGELHTLKNELYVIESECPSDVDLILKEETVYLTTDELLSDLMY